MENDTIDEVYFPKPGNPKHGWKFTELVNLAGWVREHISNRDYDPIVKEIVHGVDSKLTDATKLICILRWTYCARSQIKSYPRLVEFVRKYLDDRGANSEDLLRGLDK